jgi:hypothetical protein
MRKNSFLLSHWWTLGPTITKVCSNAGVSNTQPAATCGTFEFETPALMAVGKFLILTPLQKRFAYNDKIDNRWPTLEFEPWRRKSVFLFQHQLHWRGKHFGNWVGVQECWSYSFAAVFSPEKCERIHLGQFFQLCLWYRAFHRFGQAIFPNGGLVLGSSQFSIMTQLPSKILLDSKVVKIDPKIIISLY